MKWFRNLLSEVDQERDDIIYFSKDKYGSILVIDDGDHRVLNFDSPFEQSSMRIEAPYKLVHHYTQLMALVLAFIEPRHITLLGLGGGSLLRTFHYLLPNCIFNVIELRQKVVDIASDFFQTPDDERVTITVKDALKALSKIPNQSSDIIFSDMYGAYHMVPEQIQKTFFVHCSRILSAQGWLVVNLHSLPQEQAAFLERLTAIFPTVILTANTANTILFVSNGSPEYASQSIKNPQSIKNIEITLDQELTPLISRLKPINFKF